MRTLVFCNDPWHPAEVVRKGLLALPVKGLHFDFLEDGKLWKAEQLAKYSFILLAKANIRSAKMEQPWLDIDSQTVFFDYVRQGGGLFAVHSGTSRYDQLNVINELIGGAFSHHPDPCDVRLEPRMGHPATVGVKPFTVQDEHYFVKMNALDADIFLQSRSEYGVQPAGWTRTEGMGRIGVLTPGHNLEVWMHPEFQKLLSNTLCWVAKKN